MARPQVWRTWEKPPDPRRAGATGVQGGHTDGERGAELVPISGTEFTQPHNTPPVMRDSLEPPTRRFPQSQAGHEMVVIYSFNFPPSPLPAPYTHLQGDSGSPTTVSIFKFKTEFIHALKLAAVVANLLKEV